MIQRHAFLVVAATAAFALASCGGSDDTSGSDAPETIAAATAGVRVVSPDDAAATIADPPADLVILDVRTQEEFEEGHIEGATMLDFYRPDFAEQVAALDPDVPYVVYCRSGNRSGQTRSIMAELGFGTVDDVDGGIVAWQGAGFPVVTP